jgi:mitogen-activated protein kinase kinase
LRQGKWKRKIDDEPYYSVDITCADKNQGHWIHFGSHHSHRIALRGLGHDPSSLIGLRHHTAIMTTPAPAPLLRPSVNTPRHGGTRAPRLGLSIPSAPQVNGGRPAGRGPPLLKLATPGNTNGLMGPPEHKRTGSITGPTPASAANQYSALSFAMGLRNQVIRNSPDSSNTANGSGSVDDLDTTGGADNQDYDAMDVEELPVEGWKRARETGRIIELGSLGEGAGGAVTRCTLKGGKTVFALKVGFMESFMCLADGCYKSGHHNRPYARSQEADLP